ncbi:MAG: hypothetical protein ACJ76H_14500 [Bacteriovoracaceae bacterium]
MIIMTCRTFFLGLFVFLIAAEGRATDPCASELAKFCPDEKTELSKFSCLVSHRDDLSLECREELLRVNQLVKDTGVRGSGLSGFGGVMGSLGLIPPQKKVLTVEGNWAYEGNPTVINQGKIGLNSPLWKKDHSSFTSSLSAGTIQLNEAVSVPNGHAVSELHRVEAGGQYSATTESKKIYGLRGSIGSASDHPFATRREFIFTVNSFYVPTPKSQDSLWMYTVFLSNNSPIGNYIPIPGFIYFMKKETFTGMFGLPFMSLQWTPSKKWLYSASIFLTNIKASATYLFSGRTQAGINFANIQQTFLREDRTNIRDRLFFNERRIYAHARQILALNLVAELQSGLSFDRSLSEGQRFNDTSWRRDLGRSWFVGTSLIVSFD